MKTYIVEIINGNTGHIVEEFKVCGSDKAEAIELAKSQAEQKHLNANFSFKVFAL